MRSKILTGMKKIMQNLMGTNEEESERLLIQLAKDPKSNDVRDKIKVAIEKMMASSDTEKAFPREQLKNMIQGLSQGNLMDDLQGKDDTNGKRENFDQEVIGKDGQRMLFPSNQEGRMLDDKDYDPLKGLDRKEYIDWVNPPGFDFEAGAPGSPEEDEEDAEQPGYRDDDEDDDFMGDIEFYPSDEDAGDKEERSEDDDTKMGKDEDEDETNLEYGQDEDEVKDEFCLPGKECKDTSAHPTKYLEEQQLYSDQSQMEQGLPEQETENGSYHDNEMNTQDEAEDDGNVIEEKAREDDDNDKEVEHEEEEEDDENLMEEKDEDDRDGEGGDDDEGGCEWSEDGEECLEEETVYPHRELTSEEMRVQKLLDGEVTEETKAWMQEVMTIEENAYFLLKDLPELETVMTDDQLNGSNRVVADGIAADQECSALLQLLDGEAKQGDGYKGKKSPHTKYENFEGLTVKDAVDAASAGRIPLLYPTVYMHLAERSRQYLQRHFQLKTHLFFSFTHLVCRSAGPGIFKAYSSIKRDDLSHPVHADNCQLDHSGKCHKRLPAFVWRDWSAILYLNQEFEGGEFIFANFNQTAQAVVSPKCGRLVGFSAGEENLHGVKGVLHGRRCALAMWYTLDPRFRELEFFHAADHLNLLYEAEYKQQH